MGTAPTSKAEKLAVVGIVAPHLREHINRTSSRRVAVVNQRGEVVGYRSLADVQKALLAKHALEIELQPDERPKEVFCSRCGLPMKVKKAGHVPKLCLGCLHPPCIDCKKRIRRGGYLPTAERKTIRCNDCRLAAIRLAPKRCLDCGKVLSRARQAVRCSPCRIANNKPPDIRCVSCDEPLGSAANLAVRKGTGTGQCATCRRKNTKKASCSKCRKPMDPKALAPSTVAKRKGAPPTCKACLMMPRASCSVCGVQLGKWATSPSAIANRNGAPPKCQPCNARAPKPKRKVGPAAALKAWATKRRNAKDQRT